MFRESFISERNSIGKLLEGRDPRVFSQDLLLDLTLEDLKFLSSFPEKIRPILIDENLTPTQILDDESPIFDLAKSTINLNGSASGSIVGKSIETLNDLRIEKIKIIQNSLTQIGIERFGDINFKQLFNEKGFDLKSCTIRSLEEINVPQLTKEIKEELFGIFGFNILLESCASEEKPIRIKSLKEINSVLYSELLEELVNGYAEEKLKKRGYIYEGNTEISYSSNSELKSLGIESKHKLTMYVFNVGVNPSKFKLQQEPKRSFPNTPGHKHSPQSYEAPVMVLSNWKRIIRDPNKKASFTVVDDLYAQQAAYHGDFGSVIIR